MKTNETEAADEIIEALGKKLLLKSALQDAETGVIATSADSPYRQKVDENLRKTRERWENEAFARELRKKARKLGFMKSKYDQDQWIVRKGGRWVECSAEDVAQAILHN